MAPLGRDLPFNIAVHAGIVFIDGLRRARVGHHPRHQLLGFMNMAQRHIIIAQVHQFLFLDRHMFFVAPMDHQDLIGLLMFGISAGICLFMDLPLMVTAAVNRRAEVREPDALHLGTFQHMDIVRPLKRIVVRIFFDIIMIAGDQDCLGIRHLGQQRIHFFQFPKKGLPVEQIPGDQKQIDILFIADPDQLFQALPDLLFPRFGQPFSQIRTCP